MMQQLKSATRSLMRQVARWLNFATNGKLTPNMVTITGFVMHVPIALLIGLGHNLWAALLLLIFGLFDTLDGELARLQKRDSAKGMLLDASTDRLKEVLVYSGAGYALALGHHPASAAWAAAACGASLSVSYVKAKGEAAVAASRKELTHAQLNHLFGGGLLSFEMRMIVLIAGLLVNQLIAAVILIALLAGFTALQRLVQISRQLT